MESLMLVGALADEERTRREAGLRLPGTFVVRRWQMVPGSARRTRSRHALRRPVGMPFDAGLTGRSQRLHAITHPPPPPLVAANPMAPA